jgi:phosphate starvation-inducible PhoH-like protein
MAKKQRERKEPVNDIKTILENTDKISHQQLMTNLRKSKFQIEFKNDSQKKLWDLIDKHEITLCSGPAGTGKSYISVAKAIDLVFRENSVYKKIIIVKPMVEAEEKMGFLPGDVMEKMYPYIYSTLYLFEKIIGKNKTDALLKGDYIRPIALAFMRGINIDNAVVIVEEAQNMTNKSMKTLLTRIGENCKFIISGDLEQSDLFKNEKDTGLYNAIKKLKSLPEVGCMEFKESEIVRNPLISKILKQLNGDFE